MNTILHSENLRDRVQIEYISLEDTKSWDSKRLLTWLSDSDIHYLIAHPHQGYESRRNFDCMSYLQDLSILQHHIGWPSAENLFCPIFTQDKFAYINSIPLICNPTLVIIIQRNVRFSEEQSNVVHFSQTSAVSATVLQFTESHSYNDGWVIKLPFVTHSLGIKFTKDRSKIPSIIEYMVSKYASFVPYVMVQPCVPNRLECKVVLLDVRIDNRLDELFC